MTTTEQAIEDGATRLREVQRTAIPLPPVRDELASGGIVGAYAVHARNTAARLAEGGRLIGRKIGPTSAVVPRQLGVDQLDFGALSSDIARPAEGGCDLAPRDHRDRLP